MMAHPSFSLAANAETQAGDADKQVALATEAVAGIDTKRGETPAGLKAAMEQAAAAGRVLLIDETKPGARLIRLIPTNDAKA